MKRILQINSVYNEGSTGHIIQEISKAIEINGDKSYIAYGYPSKNRDKAFQISNWFDVRLHNKLSYFSGIHGCYSLICTNRFLNFIDDLKPDIIHLHNIHGGFLNYPTLFKYIKRKQIPIVWTLHDCWAFTGKCTHFTIQKCNKWINGCYHCANLHTYPHSFILDRSKYCYEKKKLIFTNIDNISIVTVSRWLSNIISQSFLSKFSNTIIPNGIDINVFKPINNDVRIKYNIGNRFMILGVASIWNNGKGLKTFIEIAKFIDNDICIVLVGLSSNQIKQMPSNIRGIKQIKNINDLVALYSTADCFLNMSLEETFGLVTAEAMACGTPAIVLNSSANPELIIDKSTGYIVDNQNVQIILNKIMEIKVKGKTFYKNSCIYNVRNNFSIELMQRRYLDLYNNI